MAVYTKLEFLEVEKLINQYDIGKLKSFREIEEGVENSNYLIHAEGGDYILTIYEKRVREDDLPFFLGLTEHLGKNAIPCPSPVHDKIGAVLQEVKGKKGALVTFLEGKSVSEIIPSNCREVGVMLAKMHIAGEGFALKRKNCMAMEGWKDLFSKTTARMNELSGVDSAVVEGILEKLKKNWPGELPSGIIHADLFPDNVFFKGETLSGVIDFYFACNDFLAYDLSICVNSWCFDNDWNFVPEKAAEMVAGYNSVRKITQDELEKFPILALGSALRFFLTRTYDWLNPAPGLVKKRNPLEYWRKLQFHDGIGNYREYGI